jgi:hypothetical protein
MAKYHISYTYAKPGSGGTSTDRYIDAETERDAIEKIKALHPECEIRIKNTKKKD